MITGLCSGAEGTAVVSLDDQGPFELPCGEGASREITRSLPLKGNRLLVTVVSAPADAAWALAASSAP